MHVVQPVQQSMGVQGTVRVVSLTREDLRTERLKQISRLHKTAFSDDKPCCCCCVEREADAHKNFLEGLSESPDAKLEGFGVAVDVNGDVLGFAMLGFHDTPGDVSMRELPECFHPSPPQGTCHLEQIAVYESARGNGVGKKLMSWADEKARERGCTTIVLEVIGRNTHAKLIYEKAGYVVSNSACRRCMFCPVVCCLMRTPIVYEMKKALLLDSSSSLLLERPLLQNG